MTEWYKPRQRQPLAPTSVRLRKNQIELGADVVAHLGLDAEQDPRLVRLGWDSEPYMITITRAGDDRSGTVRVSGLNTIAAAKFYAWIGIGASYRGVWDAELCPDGSVSVTIG